MSIEELREQRELLLAMIQENDSLTNLGQIGLDEEPLSLFEKWQLLALHMNDLTPYLYDYLLYV